MENKKVLRKIKDHANGKNANGMWSNTYMRHLKHFKLMTQ